MCGGEVSWSADYSFEDYGYEGEGIVHRYRCTECGAIHEVCEEIEEEPKQVDDRQITFEELGEI